MKGYTPSMSKRTMLSMLAGSGLSIVLGCATVPLHAYNPNARVDPNAVPPPVACTKPASTTVECAPLPACAGSASCDAVDATHNVCNYSTLISPRCDCFAGEQDFCYVFTTSPYALGVRKCELRVEQGKTVYRWTQCTSPNSVP